MNREELESYWDEYGKFWYYKEREADSVMDALEERIKSLQEDNLAKDMLGAELMNENRTLKDKIKELEATQPKWISVKDRLPKVDEYVLVFYNGSQDVCLLQEYSNGNIEWCDGEFNYPLKTFTHWMPLPEAPKSDDLPTSGNHKSDVE